MAFTIPEGIVLPWLGTHAAIPAGWSRCTQLDGNYARGEASAGGTGGDADHTHVSPAHGHASGLHLHSLAGTSGATNASVNVQADGVHQAAPQNHDHDFISSDNAATSINTTAVTIDATANDPQYEEVIFVKSDGAGELDPTMGVMADVALTDADWTIFGVDAFLKGAGTGADAGATGTGSHTHTNAAHTHTASASHVHTGTSDSFTAVERPVGTFGPTAVCNISHSHVVDLASTTPTWQNAAIAVSNTAFPNPPYIELLFLENTGAGVITPEEGIIGIWTGDAADIPSRWIPCDGTEGTIDLTGGDWIRGATNVGEVGDAGGAIAAHGHTSVNHTHAPNAHNHTMTMGDVVGKLTIEDVAGPLLMDGTHTHTQGTGVCTPATIPTGNTNATINNATETPPWYGVIFVRYIGETGGVDMLEPRPADIMMVKVPAESPNANVRCDLVETSGKWTPVMYRPDISAVGPGDFPIVKAVRGAENIVCTIIPEPPGDLHIGWLDTEKFESRGANVLAGEFHQCELELFQPPLFAIAMVLVNDAGTYRWHQTIGRWNHAVPEWTLVDPAIECDTDPGGGFPNALNASASLRFMNDASLLFAFVDEDSDLRLFRQAAIEGDATGVWEPIGSLAGTFYECEMEVYQPNLLVAANVLQKDAGVYRWYQTVGLWDPAVPEWALSDPAIECDTDPGGGFPDALRASAGLRMTADGGLLFAFLDNDVDLQWYRQAAVHGDGSGIWEAV